MLKKLFTFGILATACNLAYANGGTPAVVTGPLHFGPTFSCCNFYVGTAVSGDFGNVSVTEDSTWTTTSSDQTVVENFHRQWNQTMSGVNGEIYTGYGVLIPPFLYVGLEGFLNISSAKGTADLADTAVPIGFSDAQTDATTAQYKVQNEAGVRARLGAELGNNGSMVYGVVGVVEGRVQVAEDPEPGPSGTAPDRLVLPFAMHDFKSNRTGLELGFGLENPLGHHNLSLRIQYVASIYPRFEDTITTPSFTVPLGSGTTQFVTETSVLSTRFIINQVSVGLTYHFC